MVINMSVQRVKEYLKQWGREDDVQEFPVSSATVELAAQALNVEPARIAKTLSFYQELGNEGGEQQKRCILIVAAGDAKVDNRRFKEQFGFKAKMLSPDDALALTGYAVGGICPFAIDSQKGTVYLDESLRRFDVVYPACGSSNSAIAVTCDQLQQYAASAGWIDVCKNWRAGE